MNYYEEARKYEKQIARKRYIKPRLPMLKDRRYELEQQIKELYKKKLSEDADVKRMEGHSLSAFVYAVVGKRDEKLDKERKEAYEATVKYNVALVELEALEKEISQMEYDLGCYINAEKNYDEALRVWTNEMAETIPDGQDGQQIRQLQKQLGAIEAQRKEIDEAKRAAERAIATTEHIISGLDNAHSWGVYDAFIGGRLFADMVKYDQINQVEDDVHKLQVDLIYLEKELKDIKVQENIAPIVTADLRFADIFFDGLIFDLSALGKINKSKARAEDTWRQLKGITNKLRLMEEKLSEEEADIKKQLADALTSKR